jgi:hypothetical protein
MLSSMETWGEEHEGFVLRDFYNMVHGWFDDPTDNWVINTLAYWNKYVFYLFIATYLFYCCPRMVLGVESKKSSRTRKSKSVAVDPAPATTQDQLLVQRAARKQAKAAAAAKEKADKAARKRAAAVAATAATVAREAAEATAAAQEEDDDDEREGDE